MSGPRADGLAQPLDPFDPALRRLLIAAMGSLPHEQLRILFLDGARRFVGEELLNEGTPSRLAICPRTIFARALALDAAAIILVHNHPSGDARPSAEDIWTTRKLDQVGRTLDIAIIDHMIVTATRVHHIMSEDAISGRGGAPSRCTLRSPSPAPGDDEARILQNARIALRRRLLRRQLLGASDLFGEPAWDMLLDLFIHQAEGRSLSMSALCLSSGIPTSSAMKLIQRLCDAGLLERLPDPRDGRRSLIRISPDTRHRLRAYFAEGIE